VVSVVVSVIVAVVLSGSGWRSCSGEGKGERREEGEMEERGG